MPNSARSRTSAASGTQRERVRADRDADQQIAEDRRQPDEPADDDDDDRGAEQNEDQLQRLRHRARSRPIDGLRRDVRADCSTRPRARVAILVLVV